MRSKVCSCKKEPKEQLNKESNPLDAVAVIMLVQVDKVKPQQQSAVKRDWGTKEQETWLKSPAP